MSALVYNVRVERVYCTSRMLFVDAALPLTQVTEAAWGRMSTSFSGVPLLV